MNLPRSLRAAILSAAIITLASPGFARDEKWQNATGETFSAAPAEILGPWALFDDGTFVPLSKLTPEECVRFYEGIKDNPQRAADWKDAKSAISQETYGRLLKYKGEELAPDSEAGQPEPEFYIIFFTQGDKNMSWNELQRSTPSLYAATVKKYPGLVQGIVFGVGDTVQDQFDISVNTHGDWLFTVFDSEVQMRTLTHRIPTNNYGIVVMTRTGVPLYGPESTTDDQVKDTFKHLDEILKHITPGVQVWAEQVYFWRQVQPVIYAEGTADPKLIGNPLSVAILRRMNIHRVDATFHVAASGEIQSVEVVPNGMDAKTVSMFAGGLKEKTAFVPAVDHGKFVAGTYQYHLEVAE
ncbi:MAG TPA: hypothetical protein VGG34_14670 [Opitutaceae bacterium]|jgi:hypothetical protein